MALRIEKDHWEGNTVVGKKAGKEAVVHSLLEKNRKLHCHPDIRQVFGLHIECHEDAQERVRREVLSRIQDHYRGQRIRVL